MSAEVVFDNGRVYHLGLAPGELASNLVQVGDPQRAYRVAARFDEVRHEIRNREFVTLTGTFGGLPVSVLGTGIGTDNVEIALIEAHALLRLDADQDRSGEPGERVTLIRVGTSGGVQTDVPPGALAISEYALGLDSTGLFYDHRCSDPIVEELELEARRLVDASVSRHARFRGWIRPYAARCSPDVHRALSNRAAAVGAPAVSGITLSTPGFYGPSGRVVEGLSNTLPRLKSVLSALSISGRRIVNVEMESSLMFHLMEALGHRAGTICPIIGSREDQATVVDYAELIDRCIDIALATLQELAT
jgi:uridine phosphorylase